MRTHVAVLLFVAGIATGFLARNEAHADPAPTGAVCTQLNAVNAEGPATEFMNASLAAGKTHFVAVGNTGPKVLCAW